MVHYCSCRSLRCCTGGKVTVASGAGAVVEGGGSVKVASGDVGHWLERACPIALRKRSTGVIGFASHHLGSIVRWTRGRHRLAVGAGDTGVGGDITARAGSSTALSGGDVKLSSGKALVVMAVL